MNMLPKPCAYKKARANEHYSDEESGQYSQKDWYLEKCCHRTGDEAVYGHSDGEEEYLSPRQALVSIRIRLKRIRVDADDEVETGKRKTDVAADMLMVFQKITYFAVSKFEKS